MVRVWLIVSLLCLGCYAESPTIVAMTLSNHDDITKTKNDYHFELFATVNGGVVSVKKFDIVTNALGDGLLKEHAVFDHFDPEIQLGVVDGIELTLRPVGGIRFTVDINLTGATDAFITREADLDTDPVPNRDETVMECDLAVHTRGTISCLMTKANDENTVLGSLSLVLPSDGINGI